MKKTVLLCALIPSLINTTQAQQGFKNQSVSVFKNASAFFIKSGNVNATNGKWLWQSDSLPAMLEGTFWVNVSDNELVSLKSSLKDKKETNYAQSYAEMLEVNNGKRVRLYFQNDTTEIEGKIQLLKKDPKDYSYLFAIVNGQKTSILSADRLNNLHRIEFLENANFQKETATPTPTLEFEFKNAKANQTLWLMYLQKNLSWNPEYKLELLDDKKGKLTMQAAVVNEAEDIETEALNLVAGVPNFKYATTVHRFIKFLIANAGDFEYSITPQAGLSNFSLDNSVLSNVSYQMLNDRTEVGNTTTTTTTMEDNVDGGSVEDLYYYTLKNIQLKRGERALYDVFSLEIPIEHIYETELPENSVQYSTSYTVDETTHKVKHNLKLKNTGSHVWTSGSILVLNNEDGRLSPISQDALKYTSIQEEREVYLTEAPDVSVRTKEKEVERKVDEKRLSRDRYAYYYDLVTIETEIKLHNFKDKPIRLDLKRYLNGEGFESSEKWEMVRLPSFDAYSLNGRNRVCWELTLNAKEEKTIKYKYKVYVQRYSKYE